MQQGDPLGPVFFALAVRPAIAEARAATVSHPEGIDLCSFFFLDDGFCAGSAPAVSCFLIALTEGFRRIGLTVNLDKTEVIPACLSAQSFGPGDFQGCSWNGSSNFKLLGDHIGSNEWCKELVGRRIAEARALLSVVGKFPDAQSAFCFCIRAPDMSHGAPDAQQDSLRTADSDIRAALSQLILRPLSDGDWRLAFLGIAAGGTRPGGLHRELFRLSGTVRPTLAGFRSFRPRRWLPPHSGIPSGTNIYAWLRPKPCPAFSGTPPSPGIVASTSRLAGSLAPGPGSRPTRRARILASPPPLFRVALQRRLRMPLWYHDSACGTCGEASDRWGDHALSCCCGGGTVLRHNAVHLRLPGVREAWSPPPPEAA